MFIRKKKVLELIDKEIKRIKEDEDKHYQNFIIDPDGEVSTFASARYLQAAQDRVGLQNIKNKIE